MIADTQVRFPASAVSVAVDISLGLYNPYVLEKHEALLAFGQCIDRGPDSITYTESSLPSKKGSHILSSKVKFFRLTLPTIVGAISHEGAPYCTPPEIQIIIVFVFISA